MRSNIGGWGDNGKNKWREGIKSKQFDELGWFIVLIVFREDSHIWALDFEPQRVRILKKKI